MDYKEKIIRAKFADNEHADIRRTASLSSENVKMLEFLFWVLHERIIQGDEEGVRTVQQRITEYTIDGGITAKVSL